MFSMEGPLEVSLVHLLFVPEGKSCSVPDSDSQKDFADIFFDHLIADSQTPGDFTIRQAMSDPFDDQQLSLTWPLK